MDRCLKKREYYYDEQTTTTYVRSKKNAQR